MLRSILILSITVANLVFGIENSIIKELDAHYCLQEFRSKFSTSQYQEIEEALEAPLKLRIMSYNILSQEYDRMQKEENCWQLRKNRVLELITHASPDIFCCQELTPVQINDLMSTLGKEYAAYTPLPSDERCYHEILGIFYKKDRFELTHGEKNELGMIYFWEALNVYCFQYYLKTELLHKITGKSIVVFNTHPDFFMPDVRGALVESVLNDAEATAHNNPTIICGDFNTFPSSLPDFFKAPSTIGVDGPYILQKITKNRFRDSLDLVLIAHAGPMASYTCDIETLTPFTNPNIYGLILDHIFVNPDKVKVLFHAIEPAKVDGHFPSDHLPVIADVIIP